MNSVCLLACGLAVCALSTGAQILPLPDRSPKALSGSEFIRSVGSVDLADRESKILRAILDGNAPPFLRRLVPVTVMEATDGRTNSMSFYVTPDYLAVGSDEDYFLCPLTPMTAQMIADQSGCTLPTRRMVDAIYAQAAVKLAPAPIPPGPAMTTVAVFAQHNEMVRTQRTAMLNLHPPGELVAGHKKDVVISAKLAGAPGKVAIYGWHQTNGTAIQPLYLGHTAAWVDYSHGIRLAQQGITVNGQTTTVARVLADPKLAYLLSDEGVILNSRYPTNATALSENSSPDLSAARSPSDGEKVTTRDQLEFKPTGYFGERVATFHFEPEVRIQINAPAADSFSPGNPILLILYALPNGNTIEQTAGKKLQPGDDWHFDIQHIGAQTRFLRSVFTNQTLVVAYLEAEMKSWPAWRRKHGDAAIPGIIARIQDAFPTNKLEVVLTGHSGGGSFTFGYLNTVDQIPGTVERIAFLDSNYAYETTNHLTKLVNWLKASPRHALCVLAYHDSIALLDGKTFVSERGGTWGRSHAMLADLSAQFSFTSRTNAAGLQTHTALNGRLQILLKENPDKKILHTVQVERNGFIHAMLTGTPFESQGYEYFGERAYLKWIQPD